MKPTAASNPTETENVQRAKSAQLQLLLRQQRAMQARDDLMAFVKFTSPSAEEPNNVEKSSYVDARHHRAIARALEQVERGEIRQLILTMPPRHGKTELATKRFGAWVAGRHPRENIAVASYSDDMAEDFGADTRAITSTPQFKQVFPTFKLRRGGTSKSNIQTTEGGRLVFVGRGGALTGRGAHLLIIDDLIKDADEARSPTVRDQAWNWFTKVAMTRRMGKKLVLIIMTRWHADDVIGRLTDPENPCYNAIEASKWKIINLPALAEDDDPLGREVGEPLWPDGPDKFDLDFLESQQRLDPMGFASLYQQRPSAADGTLFRREYIRYYDPDDMPEDLRYYCSSDHAVSTRQHRDYTVLLKAAIDKQDNIYLTECFWKRAASHEAVEAMLTMGTGRTQPLFWWAERGHISSSIGPFLRKRMEETKRFFTLIEVTPVGDKEQRAQSISARMALGHVWLPKGAPWVERAINELMLFPNGTHDDFVDALALIGLGLRSLFRPGKSASQKKKEEPVYGTLGWVKYQESWEKRERLRLNAARGY